MLYLAVRLLEKIGHRHPGSRLKRVMASTANTRFYNFGSGVGLFLIVLSMLFHSGSFFFAGLAVVMGTLAIDLVLRLSIEHEEDKPTGKH